MNDDSGKNDAAEPKAPEESMRRRQPNLTDDDLLGRLVRLGAEDPRVPSDGASRLESQLRPLWEAKVASRRRRAGLLYFAGAIAAALLFFFLASPFLRGEHTPPPAVRQVLATVAALEGEAWAGDDLLRVGDSVRLGDRVRTSSGSRIALSSQDGRSIRLDRRTSIELQSRGALLLSDGTIYMDSGPDSLLPVDIRTSFGTVREIGTQFVVSRLADSITVRVRSGRVRIESENSETLLGSGEGAQIGGGGVQRLETAGAADDHWHWVYSVTPPFDLNGKTVADYLRWVEREAGLRISVGSEELGERLETIRLRGELREISAEDSLSPVLSTAGLDIVKEGDGSVRVISSGDGS